MSHETIAWCFMSLVSGFLLGVLYMGVYAVTIECLAQRKDDRRTDSPSPDAETSPTDKT